MNDSTPLLGSGIGFGRYGQHDISGLAAFGRQGQPSGIACRILDRSFPIDIHLERNLHGTALGGKRVLRSSDCQSRRLIRYFGRLSRSFSGRIRIFDYRIIFFTAPCENHSCKKKQRTKFRHRNSIIVQKNTRLSLSRSRHAHKKSADKTLLSVFEVLGYRTTK